MILQKKVQLQMIKSYNEQNFQHIKCIRTMSKKLTLTIVIHLNIASPKAYRNIYLHEATTFIFAGERKASIFKYSFADLEAST